MAIVQEKMKIERSIYEMLQIVSISLTDITNLKDLFAEPNYNIVNELDDPTDASLFKLLNFIIIVRKFYRTAMKLLYLQNTLYDNIPSDKLDYNKVPVATRREVINKILM